MNLATFLEAIRTETLDFSFGNPWRYDDLSTGCVTPIIRQSDKERSYITSQEAGDLLKMVDQGHINNIRVTNEADKPVFIRMGEIIKGDTQERALIMSRIIFPGEKVDLAVRCIHASKGIRSGAKVGSSGSYAPGKEYTYTSALFKGEYVDQNESWVNDREYSANVNAYCVAEAIIPIAGAPSFTRSSDDLFTVSEKVKESLKDVIEKCPLVDNQIGLTLIDTKGFHSLDCFDLHVSWKAVKEAIVGKESLKLAEHDNSQVFSYNPERAKEVTKNILKNGYETKESFSEDNRTKTITFKYNDNHYGEAVTIEEDVVHLLIARED